MMGELNTFQFECERFLMDLLDQRGFQIQAREVVGGTEKYVHLRIANSDLEVWIYEDEAEYRVGDKHYNFEFSYYRDESKLIESFIRGLAQDLPSRR